MTTNQNRTFSDQDVSGNIEGLFQNRLVGWLHVEGMEKPPNLRLCVDGEPTLSVWANKDRPDVQAMLGHGENSGFIVDLSRLATTDVVELSFSVDDTSYTFNDVKLKYCKGISKHYKRIRELFFCEYYRCKYDLSHMSNDAAFQHFITHGIFENKNPNPWFSNDYYVERYPERVANGEVPLLAFLDAEPKVAEQPSSLFDPIYYKAANPDLANEPSLLRHFCMHGRREGRVGAELVLPPHVVDEFNDIAELDPLIATAAKKIHHIVRYPHISKAMYAPRIISKKLGSDVKAVICVPFISRGGADLISTFVFRAYQEALGKEHVVMIVTDKSSIEVPEWLEDGSRVICLDDECTFVNDEERKNTLHFTIGHLAPEKIVNINSHTLWKVYEQYGVQLSTVADLYAYLFCFDYNLERQKVGYITDYLPGTIKCLKSVFCDNAQIIEDIKSIYGFHESETKKLHTVYVPAAENINQAEFAASGNRDTVLWIGRLSLQKRPDILINVAQAMPGQKFAVYGPPGNSKFGEEIVQGKHKNIQYMGVYNSVNELDYSPYALYLNTSEWEGLPTVIIQMMAVGMPIVTSSVCGITELVNDQTGWLVEDFEDSKGYVRAINSVLINTDIAIEKRQAAFDSVAATHTWAAFYAALESSDAFTDHDSMMREDAKHQDRRRAA